MRYSPISWYWLVGNKPGQVFSASAKGYVGLDDAGYVAFLADDNKATVIACDGYLAHVFWRAAQVDQQNALALMALAAAAGISSLGTETGAWPPGDAVNMLAQLGVGITSTGTPALSGTYGADPTARANLVALATEFNILGVFPGGGSTFPYRDVANVAHDLSFDHLKAIGAAVATYYGALLAWEPTFLADPATSPPARTATIA